MIKKILKTIIKFLDNHRLILVLLILFIISSLFLGINSLMFLNHNFKPLECTSNEDENYCYNNELKIFKNPTSSQKEFFETKKEEIAKLKNDYDLPEFNYYSAYYYEEASRLEVINTGNEELFNFFNVFSNTYNLKKFYQKNNLYFDIFYKYKID